jgi:hypothetical protein
VKGSERTKLQDGAPLQVYTMTPTRHYPTLSGNNQRDMPLSYWWDKYRSCQHAQGGEGGASVAPWTVCLSSIAVTYSLLQHPLCALSLPCTCSCCVR